MIEIFSVILLRTQHVLAYVTAQGGGWDAGHHAQEMQAWPGSRMPPPLGTGGGAGEPSTCSMSEDPAHAVTSCPMSSQPQREAGGPV